MFVIPSDLFPPAAHPPPNAVTTITKKVVKPRPVTRVALPQSNVNNIRVQAPLTFLTTVAPVTTSITAPSPIIKTTIETVEESPRVDYTGHFE